VNRSLAEPHIVDDDIDSSFRSKIYALLLPFQMMLVIVKIRAKPSNPGKYTTAFLRRFYSRQ